MNAKAALGPKGKVRVLDVYAPTAHAVAMTAHICTLSMNTGPGKKFVLGRKWLDRIAENGQEMQDKLDES